VEDSDQLTKDGGRLTARCSGRRLRAAAERVVVIQTGADRIRSNMGDEDICFAVLAEKEGDPRGLFLHGLTITKLYDHIVVPYEEDKPFFIDGVPLERKTLRRIKIIRQDDEFVRELDRLHNRIKNLRTSDLYSPIADYPGRLLALFQERDSDVTSDVINAYREKKKLKLPVNEIVAAAAQIAIEAIRRAG
jgi:hypothetical protein